MLTDYFENIVSRTWLGQENKNQYANLAPGEIEEVMYEKAMPDKVVILGRTAQYYFLIEGFNSDGFLYGNALLNTNLKTLIGAYKDRLAVTGVESVDDFVDKVLLHTKLEKVLTQSVVKTKRLKI